MWFFISTGKVTICAAKTYQTTVLDLLDLGLLVAVLVLAHAHGVKQATCTEEGYELTAHVPDPPVRRSVPFVPVPVPRAGAA